MRTALLSRAAGARAAPAFECAWCCTVYTFVAPISSDTGIPVFPSVMAVVSLVSTVLLIWKLAQVNKSSMEKGFMFASRPILAIREEREASSRGTTWLLPWYFIYVIANALFMVRLTPTAPLDVFAQRPPPPKKSSRV